MSQVPNASPVPDVWAPDLVIYHDKCADGIVAAWACWKRWGTEPEYLAANYGSQPPEDVSGRNILIVDFSYSADVLRSMVAAGAKSIIILDHHKTAEAALEDFACPDPLMTADSAGDVLSILALFDMERSGARMAWDFVHPGTDLPRLVRLAERYDLWRFEPATEDAAEVLHLTIQARGLTVAAMDELDQQLTDGDGPLEWGKPIMIWRDLLIREIASRAYYQTVGGVECVIAVECPYSLVSSVGHALLDMYPESPFAAMSVSSEHGVTWSLRSHGDRMDVSEVASRNGGGGHRNAAGFRVTVTDAEDRDLWKQSEETASRQYTKLAEEHAIARYALEWYAEQVAGCRKITSDGDKARHALDADGGKRALVALGRSEAA